MGQRSGFPLRLQQVLSGGGRHTASPALKLESEPPSKVKAYIDRVIKSPLPDIAIPLSGFRWEYGKGNFHHWRPLFLHFDAYFKSFLSQRKDLLLSDDIAEEDLFPKHSVLQILRVMQKILENCPNKCSFNGIEHFKLLLASTDPEILIAALETMSALVKINPSKIHVNGKLIGCGSVNNYLLSLAQGWGSKEEGLGLHSCIVTNERSQLEGLSLFPSDVDSEGNNVTQYQLGSTLHFEFNVTNSQDSEKLPKTRKGSNLNVIHIEDLHARKQDDLAILKQCVAQYGVPLDHRFSLLTRIRFSNAFRSPRSCRLYSRICILAFIVLVQSSDAHEELVSFFANEPEYTNELIKLVQSDYSVPGNVRALSMLALGAQLAAYASSQERARILNGSSIISAGGNRMVLLSALQKAILSLNRPSDSSCLLFVDALLQFFLLHVLSSSSSGSAIRGSGIVPPLVPLIHDSDYAHVHLVCSAVKILQKLMEYSGPAVSLFKDLGGMELLSERLRVEVERVTEFADEDVNKMVIGDLPKVDEDRLYMQKRLIKALLKALGSATYSPANSTRSQSSHENPLPQTLASIFRSADKFGGDIYFAAVTLMSEIIHKDPTCFPVLLEAGVPSSFLSSVRSGVLPTAKALICIPGGLGAICLNARGLEGVREADALRFFVDAFTTRKYIVAMNEGVVLLANAVEELFRHVSPLRSTGVDIIIEIINKLASIGEARSTQSLSGHVNEHTAMETDERKSEGHDLMSALEVAPDRISSEQLLHFCIFHVMVLVHKTMENSETCQLFVERKGLENLMKLLLRPSITQSSEGMPIALHSTVVFKGFTQHHSAALARAFASSLRDHLKKALDGFKAASETLILTPKISVDSDHFPTLFVVEFLLFFAASKDNRWVGALLAELGESSRDVLENIGHVHRETLWQLALLDDLKLEMDSRSSSQSNETQRVDHSDGDNEEQGLSALPYLDPLVRRRGSTSSIESQFSDLRSIYLDLGRAVSGSQRLTVRLGSTSQSQISGAVDGLVTSKTENDKQRTYFSSCCDMMRSLSFHINHLFLELGKAMLLSTRRENSLPNLPSSVTSVTGSIASIILDHLSFGGRGGSSEQEVSITTKCRYLGKVVDFVDGILLERPESCNPIMVNCFYRQGVIQAILTTFEATSQLLFTVNRVPTSPMEMDGKNYADDKEAADDSWIYGPLASYGSLMDHLATSSFILSSSTKHLLEQPLIGGPVPFPPNAEAFVKTLQSKILKAALPIWTHPHLSNCNLEFISAMISLMKHVSCGVEVKNVTGHSGARMPAGPPPDEAAISLIVEMGFSRSRAEEALRQVGSSSVEIATDWLFTHPDEPQEDDELARALAMSLGNSDNTASLKEKETSDVANVDQEEVRIELPAVDDLLSTCVRLLEIKEPLAFPVRDLLVMISSQNNGQYRVKVVTYVIDCIKSCCLESGALKGSMLSSLFHVLSLILHEDTAAREVAFKSSLVKIALDLLTEWSVGQRDGEKQEVPKWVTASFLSIDRLLQVDPKAALQITDLEQLKKDGSNKPSSIVIEEGKCELLSSTPASPIHYLDVQDQKRLLDLTCRCIRDQLPGETMQVVLQLCATMTKNHSVAVSFLDAGALLCLLSLPTSSLFSGFNTVAATIIRHILEDPHTLQQAMELEIKHSLITAANRHSNGRVTPRSFVQNLSFVISRDPAVFMRAAEAVCQIEMVDRPYVVLLKDREKDRSKEKDRDKQSGKDKPPTSDGLITTQGDGNTVVPASGQSKLSDSGVKNPKSHKKPPQSFTSVIDHLLDSIVSYIPQADQSSGDNPGTSSLADMEIDSLSARGKGKAVAVAPEYVKVDTQELSASLAKAVFILKLLTEVLLTYASSIHVLLRRDAELTNPRGSIRFGSTNFSSGVFHHILYKFLPHPAVYKKDKKTDGDWRHKLATRANQFLVAAAIRSPEARRRIFLDINIFFNGFVDSSDGCKIPDSTSHAFVDLLNDIFAARSPTGSLISAEASVTFVDVGLVGSLTQVLQVIDLDHSDTPKVVTGIVRVLESVTKEHVHSSELGKTDNSLKLSSEQIQPEPTFSDENRFRALETVSQADPHEEAMDRIESFNATQASGGSDSADDMDHDRDLQEFDGVFAHDVEDDFMHGNSENGGRLENGISSVEITFDIQRNTTNDVGEEEEDEDMSHDDGDDGDGIDEDDDEEDEANNDLVEEDDVHQMSHPDTDQDNHEIDDEEFDEDVLEEDEEDEEDGVILRLEEGINGMNVFDHIEVLGGSNNFGSDALRVMPIDIFGSRRQGRATSIYNLLGRSGDNGLHFDHPLLEDPYSFRRLVQHRQSENAIDMAFTERNHEAASSRLDAIFHTLRSGRSGHRFNMWLDDGHHRVVSNAPAVPQGIEELLVAQLTHPTPDPPSGLLVTGNQSQEKDEPADHLEISDAGVTVGGTIEGNNANNDSMVVHSPSFVMDDSGQGEVGQTNGDLHQDMDASNLRNQVDMQFERNYAAIRDLEVVSQASSGSGATLGESLRSLEVEIGSADGHDDGERQVPAERIPHGDLQQTRARRLLGSALPSGGRGDVSLESVSEIPSLDQVADQSGQQEEQDVTRNGSDSIDPTFLEALPEDLRAEVLSSQQNQLSQPSGEQSQASGDIDPEFLAALPPDIREEVLAQQRVQRMHQSQELEGQPVEMDAVSIIATFPSDIREEVLLTSPDTLLATLTPALVAEANMLRERFAHRYHSSNLFGMYSRSRRGDTSSRQGENIGSSGDRVATTSRKSTTGKLIEADGAPLIDKVAVKALIRLLRVVQIPFKSQLQRLLLNLCAHHEIRTALVHILMYVLMLELRGSIKNAAGFSESPYRLYGSQSHIIYSRPQYSNGVPPLLSRRILETLTYLARNHPNVAKLLLNLELPNQTSCELEQDLSGAIAVMDEDIPNKNNDFSIVLLLNLLNQPLYTRSIAHLEQLLTLLDVIMVNVEDESRASKSNESPEQLMGSAGTAQENQTDTNAGGLSAAELLRSLKMNAGKPSTSSPVNTERGIRAVLFSLPHGELQLLCSLLAREGLSDNAYMLVAEVLKKLVRVAPNYRHLFIVELSNSLQNLTICGINELHLYEDAEKVILSTSSLNGTAVLRVLQALSSLVSLIKEKEKEEDHAALSQISDINVALESLWSELSNCIGKIESSSDTTLDIASVHANPVATNVGVSALPVGSQNILPYIESFFVTCEKLRPGQSDPVQDFVSTADAEDASTSTGVQKVASMSQKLDEKNHAFVKFSEKHRKLLNSFIRQNPGLLEKSFSLLLKVPRFIDFDNKRAHFRSKIKHQHDHHHSPVRISVRRAYILEDSYNQLRMRSPQELKGRLNVHFQGEEGIDAGGLTREWYQLLSRVIFDKGALLFTTVGNESTFQPNPNSVYQTEHLSYFKFIGRVVGKALFDNQLLDVHFTRSFYKHILGVKVTYHDIEAIDPDYFKNLKWMLENDISDILDLTFSMDADEEKLILYEKTEVTDFELIPGGRNIRVTEENKHEYVNRVAEHRLTTAIRPQINAFMEGFSELIPRDLISIFNDKELELLISGLPDIDLDDLRANTEYSGYSNGSHVIQWFWEVVQSFSKEDKARFLQFVTGTSKVPLEGFSALQGISGAQRFQIHKAYGTPDHLPSAHTCFNQLDLPEYTSKEKLQERLLLAIHEGSEGFGFG